MTIREAAIQAMTELGLSKERVASILTYMDQQKPHLIGRTGEHIPPELEAMAIERAKDYFGRKHELPMDN